MLIINNSEYLIIGVNILHNLQINTLINNDVNMLIQHMFLFLYTIL